MPMKHVIIPPVLNDINLGLIFANPFAGLTTFAAMFVESVATVIAINEIITVVVDPSLPTSSTGSPIALPKITIVAEVTAIPINENNVIVVGNPMS
jgi:hypothetical protein